MPSRARSVAPGGVGDQVPVHNVAEPSLRGPDGFFGGVALDELGVIEGSARAVGVAELDDRGDVQGVVHGPVSPSGQPVGGPLGVPRGPLDGGGPVVRGEPVRGREPADVAGMADQGGGDHVTDPEDVVIGGFVSGMDGS